MHTTDFSQCVGVSVPAIFLLGRLHIHMAIETYSGVLWILPQFPKNHRRQWEDLAIRQLWRKVKKRQLRKTKPSKNYKCTKKSGILSIENTSTLN